MQAFTVEKSHLWEMTGNMGWTRPEWHKAKSSVGCKSVMLWFLISSKQHIILSESSRLQFVFRSHLCHVKGQFILYFRWATPLVSENGPEQNMSLMLWAATLLLHEPIFHTVGCEIIFGLPRKRAPLIQKSINSWASTIHIKRKDVGKSKFKREQKEE